MKFENSILEGTDEKFLEGLNKKANKVLDILLTKNTVLVDKLELLKDWTKKRRKIETFEKAWMDLIRAGFIGISDYKEHGDGTISFQYKLRNPQERIDYLENPPQKEFGVQIGTTEDYQAGGDLKIIS